MKGFERRQIKKSLTLPLLHLTSSIFSSVCLTFACVLCCAALVLLLCVALTSILLLPLLLPVIYLDPGWLQPPFVKTYLSISHNSNYNSRDIRSTCITSTISAYQVVVNQRSEWKSVRECKGRTEFCSIHHIFLSMIRFPQY